MFVDKVDIFIASGNGGAGATSFHREKFIIKGGPDGGDGGKGGDVYFLIDNNTSTLANFRGNKHYIAKNGSDGSSRRKAGKKGEDIIIKVPKGTLIINYETYELILDLVNCKHGEKIKLLSGGKGGLGNYHFRSSTNQSPTYSQKGLRGDKLHIILELKMIADVGLVGFPNAGKSSLISVLTNSKPKIADYEFSTLIPNIGVVDFHFSSFLIADIPGIIKNASMNKGLGLNFLRHIERTSLLLFVLPINATTLIDNLDSLYEQYEILQNELKNYSESLSCKDYAIVISKTDLNLDFVNLKFFKNFELKNFENCNYFLSKKIQEFKESGLNSELKNEPLFILPVSSVSNINLESLKILLYDCLKMIKKI